jgi:nicotinate-nucleotide adenylyltransferase
MAVEAREQLGLDRVDFVLSSNHPVKSSEGQLPFETRWHLLQEALSGLPGYQVSLLERIYPGTSYTVDTLALYKKLYPQAQLFFILGASDLAKLSTWKDGTELVNYAGLAVVPRFGVGLAATAEVVAQSWPDAEKYDDAVWEFPSGHRLHYLDAPVMSISASDIRRRLREGRCVASLVPFAVERSLGHLIHLVRQIDS